MKRARWVLAFLYLATCASAAAAAGRGLDLADYERLKREDEATLEMVLEAMYETALYAQASIELPALCVTPLPIPGEELVAMVDDEVASPTGALDRDYGPDDRLAMVLVTALKSQDVCR